MNNNLIMAWICNRKIFPMSAIFSLRLLMVFGVKYKSQPSLGILAVIEVGGHWNGHPELVFVYFYI